MNKEILKLLEIIKIYNHQGILEDEFNAFASEFEEDKEVTIKEIIELAEVDMSYWETE